MPAKAGIEGLHALNPSRRPWIPAFTGLTIFLGRGVLQIACILQATRSLISMIIEISLDPGAAVDNISMIIERWGRMMRPTRAVSAMAALAQETRLTLYRMLVQRGPDGLAAGVIAARLDVPPSSLTFHLQQLLHAGLVTQRRVGRRIFYAAEYATMNALLAYLTENCCGRDLACAPQACSPATDLATGGSDETPARARQRR